MTWRTRLRAASSSGSKPLSGGTAALRRFVHLLGIVFVDQRAHGVGRRDRDPLLVAPHEDGLPGAVARAELAADAALQVDLHELHEVAVLGAGDDLDAVHRAERDAGLAAGAAGLVDDGQLLRRLRTRRLVNLDFLGVREVCHSDLRGVLYQNRPRRGRIPAVILDRVASFVSEPASDPDTSFEELVL